MEVADFNDAQIETFVKNWFKDDPIKRDKFLEDFKKPEHRGVKDLAKTPLLLGMLCLAFADSMEFSPRRIDIYEDAIDALLRKWDKRRNIERDVIYKGLSHNKKKSLFTTIAYKTFIKNEYLIEEKSLVKHLDDVLKTLPNPDGQDFDGTLFLKAIEAQHGIFVERAQKYHSFAHLTFQEYFTACAISKNEKYQWELMKNIDDSRYCEVFLLTASSLDNADNFFCLFKQAIDNLIIKDEKILALLEWAKNKADTIESPYPKRDVYLFYVFLEITSDLDFACTRPLASALALLARTPDRTRVLDLANAPANAPANAFDSEKIEKMKSDYILYLVKIICNYKEKIVGCESIYCIVDFMKNASLSELAESFENKKWGDFESKLSVLIKNQNIALDWNLSSEQVKLFGSGKLPI